MPHDEELCFVGCEFGYIHSYNPYYMDQGTLCGLGPDNDQLTDFETKETVVTCPNCIRVIKHVRRLEFKEGGA